MNPLLKYIFIILSFFISSGQISAQECEPGSNIDWKLVEIKIMEQKDPPSDYVVTGEWALKSKKQITKIDDLSNADTKKIKKVVAKSGSCLVFIDTKGFWGDGDRLYYYWVVPKK